MMRIILFNKLLILFLGSFLISFCSSSNATENSRIIMIDPDNCNDNNFSDYYNIKEIIPLESCGISSLLNSDNINNIIFTNDLILISEFNSKDIKVFNNKGKFIYNIDRSGRGPEEYGNKIDIVHFYKNRLYIRNYENKFNCYDLSGNFICQSPVPIGKNYLKDYYSTVILNNGEVFISKELAGLYNHRNLNEPYYSVDIYSPEGNFLKGLLERDVNANKILIISPTSTFYKNGQELYLAPITSNTIYKYESKDTSLKAVYELKFKDHDIKQYINPANKSQYSALDFIDHSYLLQLSYISKDRIHIDASNLNKNRLLSIIINRNNNHIDIFDRASDSDFETKPGRMVINTLNKPIVLYTYSNFIDKNGKIKSSTFSDTIGTKVKIEENMNPVLCIYEEK